MKHLVLLFVLIGSVSASADTFVRIACSNSGSDAFRGVFVLMSQPDPQKSLFDFSIEEASLSGVDFASHFDRRHAKARFWQGEAQDYYQIDSTLKSEVKALVLTLEEPLVDLYSGNRTGAKQLSGRGYLTIEREGKAALTSILDCKVEL